jgi:predicted nuclease with TOPRIM domain
MKKFALISGAIIMVAAIAILAVLLIQTKASLANTKTELNAKIAELNNTNNELIKVNADLTQTNTQLTKIQSDLDEANNKLDESNKKISDITTELQDTEQSLTSTQGKLSKTEANLESANDKNVSIQSQLNQVNETVNGLEKSIDLYKETFGEVSEDGVPFNYVLNDSAPVSWTSSTSQLSAPLRNYHLVNNPEAVNPTYVQLINFLKTDKTDNYRYVANYFMCGNFAEMLHNNAEAAGIRAAVVFISFTEGPGHAIDAFLTTDKGLVYIDDTGTATLGPASMDSTVLNLKINSIYTPVFLFPSGYFFYPTNWKVTDIQIYW